MLSSVESIVFFAALLVILTVSLVFVDALVIANIKACGTLGDDFWKGRDFDRHLWTFAVITALACLAALGHQYLSTRPGQFEQTNVTKVKINNDL